MRHPFVEFVIERDLVPAGAITRLVQSNRYVREPIGMIALSHGLLTPDQIDAILDRQRGSNKRFGELGVELGFLTPQQVETLVKIQEFRVASGISEALALSGTLSCEDAARCLGAFFLRDQELADILQNV